MSACGSFETQKMTIKKSLNSSNDLVKINICNHLLNLFYFLVWCRVFSLASDDKIVSCKILFVSWMQYNYRRWVLPKIASLMSCSLLFDISFILNIQAWPHASSYEWGIIWFNRTLKLGNIPKWYSHYQCSVVNLSNFD